MRTAETECVSGGAPPAVPFAPGTRNAEPLKESRGKGCEGVVYLLYYTGKKKWKHSYPRCLFSPQKAASILRRSSSSYTGGLFWVNNTFVFPSPLDMCEPRCIFGTCVAQ